MGSVNRVILVGNLGRDAETRFTSGGVAVVTFSMATTEVFKDREGQRQERTEWHRIKYFGKSAEAVVEYLKKGKQIYVEGRLQTDKYKDKEGNDRTSVEVRVDRLVLLGSGGGRPSADCDDSAASPAPAHEAAEAPPDDDIPF